MKGRPDNTRLAGLQTQTLSVLNRHTSHRVNLPLLRSITRTLLLDLLLQEQFDLGICLVSSEDITRLNEDFLDHSGPTDVLSFDYSDLLEDTLHGEVFVCVDVAMQQARRFRTSWPSELTRYVVHGVLHLVGFDDSRPDARRRMKREETRLLHLLRQRYNLEKLKAAR